MSTFAFGLSARSSAEILSRSGSEYVGFWPDPLLAFLDTVDVGADEAQPFWIKADIPAGETALVDIPLDGVKPGKYTLTVYVAHKDNTPLAPDGERILEQTLPLEIPKMAK